MRLSISFTLLRQGSQRLSRAFLKASDTLFFSPKSLKVPHGPHNASDGQFCTHAHPFFLLTGQASARRAGERNERNG